MRSIGNKEKVFVIYPGTIEPVPVEYGVLFNHQLSRVLNGDQSPPSDDDQSPPSDGDQRSMADDNQPQ